jgi:hypothetical protein
MPPYHTLSIDEPTRINVQITDFEDCTESQPIHYSYLPARMCRTAPHRAVPCPYSWSERWIKPMHCVVAAVELTQARLTESKKRRMDDGLKDFWSQFGGACH